MIDYGVIETLRIGYQICYGTCGEGVGILLHEREREGYRILGKEVGVNNYGIKFPSIFYSHKLHFLLLKNRGEHNPDLVRFYRKLIAKLMLMDYEFEELNQPTKDIELNQFKPSKYGSISVLNHGLF